MTNSYRCHLLALILAACFSMAHATDDLVTLNFVNSDMESAIKAVGVITGKNFVIDPRVKGTINIVSNQPVARDLVYPILLSALRQQGFTAVDNGSIIKVMPEADAKAQSTQVLNRQAKSSGDRLVTKIYPLTYESATQLANTLKPLISPNNVIAAYQGKNTLVITDYADNIACISRIIDNIDQPPLSEVFTIPIRHASALDIAQTIARLMPEVLVQGAASPIPVAEGVRRTVVVSDQRGNQLLVRSEAAPHAKQIRSLVASLDPQLTCAILGVPVADLIGLLGRHAGFAEDDPRHQTLLDAAPLAAMVSPLSMQPKVPSGGRFIYGGVADRVVHPRDQVVKLWEHWGKPEIVWYRGGHAGFFTARPVQKFVDAAIVQSGLVGRR